MQKSKEFINKQLEEFLQQKFSHLASIGGQGIEGCEHASGPLYATPVPPATRKTTNILTANTITSLP